MDESIADLRERRHRGFLARGMAFAVTSGVCYGLYTGFLTLAETQGPWRAWLDGTAGLPAFTVTFALAALAAGLNDAWSGVWALLDCARNGQLRDFWKVLHSRPGGVMVLCAVIGGPFATVCYVVGLNFATLAEHPGMIVPIAALNCAIGAILGRLLFKQELASHTVLGIIICLVAGSFIGGASISSIGFGVLTGCVFAFFAAFGWGFEGCVAGFGTVLIDYRIGIAIRQCTAGILELFVVFPLLTMIGGAPVGVGGLLGEAMCNSSLLIFAVSGFFAMPAYSFWYKGNSMCGTALGMACNGMYAFWGPFFIWLILGILNVGGMSASYPPLSAAQWVGAVVMVVGIFCIAVNPVDVLYGHWRGANARGLKVRETHGLEPLYYAIVRHFADGRDDCVAGVIGALGHDYYGYKLLNQHYVEEALATAKENGLLEEVRCDLDNARKLRVWYKMSDFGHDMVKRYLEPCSRESAN